MPGDNPTRDFYIRTFDCLATGFGWHTATIIKIRSACKLLSSFYSGRERERKRKEDELNSFSQVHVAALEDSSEFKDSRASLGAA